MASDRGTTLLLFPVAVLVMMMLGAIAVDLGQVQLAHRQLVRAVGTAADDAADQLDITTLRDAGAGPGDSRLQRLDGDAARRIATDDLATVDLPGRPVGAPIVTLGPAPGMVTVSVTRDVPHIFGRAVPGVPDAERITVRMSGRLQDPSAR